MKDTSRKIGQKIKRFGIELFAFFTSKIFIKNFAGILAMGLVLFFFTTTWLKCYTNHGESSPMPNFENMNLLEVKDIAKKKGFDIVVDSVSLDNKAPLTIIKQTPKPDALVKEKRTIYLRVQQVTKEMVEIPTLDGKNESYDKVYRKQLIRNKINPTSVTRINSRLSSNTVLDIIYKNDTITDQVRDGHYKIPRDSKLTIVVSTKGYGNTKVPNLICKTYNEAKVILKNHNLNIGTITNDETVTNKYSAFVWLQDPSEGASIRYGEQVKLRITQNLPDNCDDQQ
ncbi:MAG TPA: PASTA domain-containing protein [Phaeodactylibacter sp.]|nr:PASTA domain-containing protein [Phaeodactylibacter sp.]